MAIFSAISGAVAWLGNAVFSGLAWAGVGVNTALALGQAAGYLASSLIYAGISKVLTPGVNVPTQEIKAVINQTDAARRVYVGRNLVGGIRALFDVKSARLFQLVVVQHGALSGWDEFRIDGVPVAVDGAGAVTTSEKAGHVTVWTHDGSASGGDYAALNEFGIWDSSRRLDGQATFLVRASAPRGNEFMKVFPKASNTTYQWVIRGQALHDPRSSTTAYSDNAALVIGHYLTHPDGYRLDPGEIDWDSFAALADWSDLPIAQNAGGTAPNMRLWGYWTLDEEPVQVITRMRTSSGMAPYETAEGKIGLIGGPFGTPACTITTKDIRALSTKSAISEREGYNTLRVSFLSADHAYEMTEVDPWVDPARVAQEGVIAQELRPEMCPSQSQAKRRAKLQGHDDNRGRVEIITNLVGLKARYPRHHGQRHTILLDYRPEDGSGRVIAGEFEVTNHEFDPVGLECRIELARVDRASMGWTPAEEGPPPAPLPASEDDSAPPITAYLTQRVVQLTSGVSQAVLAVDALPIAGRDDLRIEAQYRRVGSSQWLAMPSTGFAARSGAVEDGASYEAQVRFLGVFAGVDAWHPLGPITVQVDTVPPEAPSELIASPGGTGVHLSWRNPSGDFHLLRVYRNTLDDLGSAALVGATGGAAGQISEFSDGSAAASVPYWYWVRAANGSGVEGAAVGPATITL